MRRAELGARKFCTEGPPTAVQLAAPRQERVAHRLETESAPIGIRQSRTVLRIDRCQIGSLIASLAIRRREDDPPDQSLHRPPVGHEASCQMVEQLRVLGGSPRRPKSPGVVDQPAAEVVQPDAVDDDAGRQRVSSDRRSPAPVPAGRCRPRTACDPSRNATRTVAGPAVPGCSGCRGGRSRARRVAASTQGHRSRRCAGAGRSPLLHFLAQLLQFALRRPVGQQVESRDRPTGDVAADSPRSARSSLAPPRIGVRPSTAR